MVNKEGTITVLAVMISCTVMMYIEKKGSTSELLASIRSSIHRSQGASDVTMNGREMTAENYNLTYIVDEIINGKGFFLLKNALTDPDIKKAKTIVDQETREQQYSKNVSTSKHKQNDYAGLVWKLLEQGEIFEKIALHPAIMAISRGLLGPEVHISSFVSNTVHPGMEGQTPHLDYPYYENYFQKNSFHIQRPLMCVTFIVLLSNFTQENGGTAFRPFSQKQPAYPKDVEDFYRNMEQVEGEAGDIGVLGCSTQHCAMENKYNEPRVAIVQTMVPIYVRQYQHFQVPDTASLQLRGILDSDHTGRRM